jgi:hypothetical protein
MRARLTLAKGEMARAAELATAALARFRSSEAPWWIAKALRLLERAGGADERSVAEAQRIEAALKATAPTA